MLPKRRLGRNVPQRAPSSTVLRRYAGPLADEFAILCRPEAGSPGAADQAGAVYRALEEVLAEHQASFRDLVSETLLLGDVRHDLPVVLDIRNRILAELDPARRAPPPAFIQQSPVEQGASFDLMAWAVVPRRRSAWSVRDVAAAPACACEGCARSGGRLVRLGDQVSLHTTNLYGSGDDAFEQVFEMFCAGERLLDQCGMGFRDVSRVWIHLRDIDRDYDALNRSRREFFRSRGIELRPASTGVQGGPFPDTHDFSMRLEALRSPRPREFTRMSAPTLNEAWSYGADFSRGLRVAEANKVTLHVSGTASLDEAGRTVHAGDLAAQAHRMLDNIESLLAGQGAGFRDLVSGITYLKNPGDAEVLRSMYRQRGFDHFPCPMVQAPLCRPELLCETEAVAALPLETAGA